jgi:hypothetical protein
MKIDNIPETLSEICAWAEEYELHAMSPNVMNHQLAEVTTELLLYHTPRVTKSFAKKIIVGLMDDRLRNSMIYPSQPQYIHNIINAFFVVRGILLRNFVFPRSERITLSQKEKNKFGRYNVNFPTTEVRLFPDLILILALVSSSRESGISQTIRQQSLWNTKSKS